MLLLLVPADSGIGLENGVFVAAVAPGSPAARDGSLTIGDRLVAVSIWQLNLLFCLKWNGLHLI